MQLVYIKVHTTPAIHPPTQSTNPFAYVRCVATNWQLMRPGCGGTERLAQLTMQRNINNSHTHLLLPRQQPMLLMIIKVIVRKDRIQFN